jgi:hypothetical protein
MWVAHETSKEDKEEKTDKEDTGRTGQTRRTRGEEVKEVGQREGSGTGTATTKSSDRSTVDATRLLNSKPTYLG